jgi:hypothetical protein
MTTSSVWESTSGTAVVPTDFPTQLAAPSGSSLVGWIYAIAGAVASTVENWISWQSVNLFGFLTVAEIADVISNTHSIDLTTQIQTAFNYVVDRGLKLKIPNYTYKITAPLVVGATSTPYDPYNQASYVIEGDSANVIAGGSGCRFLLYGTGFDSMLLINKGASRAGTFRHFKMECVTTPAADVYAATNGVKFATTAFSAFNFKDVSFSGSRYVVGIYAGGFANGEFTTWRRVSGLLNQKFLYMDSGTGQAFFHKFYDCYRYAQLSQGSTEYVEFEMGDGGGGYEIFVEQYNSTVYNDTATPALSLPPCIYYRPKGVNGSVTFNSGRSEGLTTILDNQDASSGGITVFEGIDFAGVKSTINNPTVKSTTDVLGTSLFIFRRCNIPIHAGTDGTFYVSAYAGDSSQYHFDRSIIGAYDQTTAVPMRIACGRKTTSEVRFSDTLYKTLVPSNDAGIILNRRYTGDIRSASPMAQFEGLDDVMSGPPENLIQYPHFNAAAAIAPWVATGNFSVYQSTGGNVYPFSSSPSARYLRMPISMAVYQDVKAIAGANQYLYFIAALEVLSVNTTDRVVFSLENSTTGEVYDVAYLGMASNGSTPCHLRTIRLSGRSSQNGGSFRLKWSAPSTNSGDVSIALGWQLCSTDPNATYVLPPAGSTSTFKHDWATADSFRANGRLALPHKDDAFGSTYSGGLQDLESDIYLSNIDESLHYYANAEWHHVPQSRISSTAVGNVGAGEDDLQTTVIPAKTFTATGHTVKIDCYGTAANNANAKTVKLYFGSVAIVSQALTINQVGKWHISAEITRTGSNAQDYVYHLTQTGTTLIHDVGVGTLTQTDTSTITVKCTGTATTDNDIVQEYMNVTIAN